MISAHMLSMNKAGSMRIGVLGGTFDPVHNGHVYLAKKICQKLALDKVIFIPTYLPPHKKGVKVTPAKHRYNMLKLAISENKKFKISDMEIKRKGRSYSVETLRRLRKKYGKKAELFFITGSDSLKELDKWKNLSEILRLCKFVIVERPGFKVNRKPDGLILLHINAKDVSSSNIRSQIESKSVKSLIPTKVKAYISRYKLYMLLIVSLSWFFASGVAYSSQNESASTIARSQEMIEKEASLRENINKNDKIYLKKVVIKGATLIDREKIREVLRPFKNCWVSKDDVQLIIDSISSIYQEKRLSEKIDGVSYKINKNILNISVKEKNN